MVRKNYLVEKNKDLFFAHYLIIQKYAFFQYGFWMFLTIIFLGRISKWGRGGGIFWNISKIYTPKIRASCLPTSYY